MWKIFVFMISVVENSIQQTMVKHVRIKPLKQKIVCLRHYIGTVLHSTIVIIIIVSLENDAIYVIS